MSRGWRSYKIGSSSSSGVRACARFWRDIWRCRPRRIRFGYGDRGKPTLSHCASAPFFNLSHSGDFAALAVARCGDVGIDVEQIRPVGSEIAQRFFTDGEKAILARLSGSEWRQAFYRCWTRKEAVLKANGKGLSGGLASFDVGLATDATARPLRLQRDRSDSAQPWSVQDLALAAGFVGAVAVRAGRAQGGIAAFQARLRRPRASRHGPTRARAP